MLRSAWLHALLTWWQGKPEPQTEAAVAWHVPVAGSGPAVHGEAAPRPTAEHPVRAS